MPKYIPSANPFLVAAAALSGVFLAVHIYLHLGDYTAERGVVAFLQIVGISSAFGAMVLLVLETARNAVEKIFPRD
ncbi:hypothetical protein WOC76_18280 [Methylocystis sp. IM3]|jgi:hypothetical protein|uniref:hypothetical protein n=1 Tax=unclassified Methylocystis TaxID=2625913 RepID=UPI000F9C0755|nr:MAG: hypothetical protein EKK29_16340 [Hyphomicrobiales bacterium]